TEVYSDEPQLMLEACLILLPNLKLTMEPKKSLSSEIHLFN
ncbi:MAG: hypothetical protein ACI9C4_000833, partial [Paraglaciecola sp.]